jgi:hypothetical protein
MQVEAIYHQGQLAFTRPIRLRQGMFKVVVDIPDAELLPPPPDGDSSAALAVSAAKSSIRERIDAILAPYQNQLERRRAFTPQDYKTMWHEHLEEKYLGKR